MCNEGRNLLLENAELDDTEIRKGVQMAVDSVLENLSRSAQMISTSEEIAQVQFLMQFVLLYLDWDFEITGLWNN